MIIEKRPVLDGEQSFVWFPIKVKLVGAEAWATLWFESAFRRIVSPCACEYTTRDGRKWMHYFAD